MWPKRLTALFLVLSVAMVASWPWLFGGMHPTTRAEGIVYSRRVEWYVAVLLILLVASGISSLLIVRQAKDEVRRLANENMRRLLEGVSGDAKRKDD